MRLKPPRIVILSFATLLAVTSVVLSGCGNKDESDTSASPSVAPVAPHNGPSKGGAATTPTKTGVMPPATN